MTALEALQRFARPTTRQAVHDSCELCAVALGAQHRHLVDLQRRALCCACRPCALLFEHGGAASGRYRAVPERVHVEPGLSLSEDDWDGLDIPVRLAFLFYNSALDRWVASYPSPAGVTEAAVPQQGWSALAVRSSLVRAIAPDVEALLVNGSRQRPFECFLVPIDVCYSLVALLRTHWTGFDGGTEARRTVETFFAELRRRSRPLPEGESR